MSVLFIPLQQGGHILGQSSTRTVGIASNFQDTRNI